MDALTLVNRKVTIWRTQNTSSVMASVSGSKQAVATTKQNDPTWASGFSTAEYGQRRMVPLQRGGLCTIKMATGRITKSEISKPCHTQTTRGCTSRSGCKIQRLENAHLMDLGRPKKKLRNGIDHALGERGTVKMVRKYGKTEKNLPILVPYAKAHSRRSGRAPSIALNHVCNATTMRSDTRRQRESVRCAAMGSSTTSTVHKSAAREPAPFAYDMDGN